MSTIRSQNELKAGNQAEADQDSQALSSYKPQTCATECTSANDSLTKQNVHAFVDVALYTYAADLRRRYPERTICKGAVHASEIRECSRFGYIELIHGKGDVATRPRLINKILKRGKYFPIWVIGPNFPDDIDDMLGLLRPTMQGDEIIWRHRPTGAKPTWRDKK